MTPRTVSGTAAASIDPGRRRLYARLAGSLFLLYIAASLAESSMFGSAVGIPVQLALGAAAMTAWVLWVPMLVFEVALAVWLLARGVNPPVPL